MPATIEHQTQVPEIAPRDTRAPWQQPVLKCMGASEAETGVNSTTDATATFS